VSNPAPGLVRARDERPGAEPWVPPFAPLTELAAAARGCRGCELADAPDVRTVFGRGPRTARVVVVGDQPGDAEDRAGRPFVGRTARLLDRALAEAGFEAADVYLTTAVKHFRFQQAGPHRQPQTPEPVHVMACRPWLRAEFATLDPALVIALGGTAGRALAGPSFRIGRDRGVLMAWPTTAAPGLLPGARGRTRAHLLATVHPAAVLAAEDADGAYSAFVEDLRVGAKSLG
jgi:DNA polymerase